MILDGISLLELFFNQAIKQATKVSQADQSDQNIAQNFVSTT